MVIEETNQYVITECGRTLKILNKNTGKSTSEDYKVFGDGWSNKRLILNKLKAIVLNGLI